MLRHTLVALFGLVLAQFCVAAEDSPADRTVDLALEVVDLVVQQHLDPPVRQQMLLDGVRTLYQHLKQPMPSGIGRRVSALAGRDQERAFLLDVLQNIQMPKSDDAGSLMIDGLLTSVPGETTFIAAKEAEVENQIRGNRYVGIGIALSWPESAAGPTITNPFPQGAAYKAGIRKDDQIIEVDGVSTAGKKLSEVVDMLRGPDGSMVQLAIRRATETALLAFTLRRGVVPFETVEGYRKDKHGAWDHRTGDSDAIGYVQISAMRPSTVQELRLVEQRLRSQQMKCVILDLRFNPEADFHPTLLLADALLPEGMIGKALSPQGESEFKSGPDCLFRDWPMAVLINSTTRREAEWLAAALKDTRQAVLVGTPTAGHGYSIEQVALPSRRGAVNLWTRTLLRADGTSLLHPDAQVASRNRVAINETRNSRPRGTGLAPDIRIDAGKDWLTRYISARQEHSEPPADPQLEAAVRHLTQQL